MKKMQSETPEVTYNLKIAKWKQESPLVSLLTVTATRKKNLAT